MITGYYDTFARTVSNGFGTSTSGHVYTVNSTSSQFNVTGGAATIVPSTSSTERYGSFDRQTSDIDITGQVALSGIPATNLMTVGFVVKRDSGGNNYYSATMMVATGGAVSLRFSKVIAGSLTTLATVSTGLTYVANTFYNLRVAAFWSDALQANVLQSKLWSVGGTEPGGWMASTTDASISRESAGTTAALYARDEATTPGAVTAKIQNVAAKTYSLPIPATTDTMCADPAYAYPKQTALQSLAQAADTTMVVLDGYTSLATLFPRVRVSNSNWTFTTGTTVQFSTFTTTEFNIGTSTNISFDSQSLYLPVGIWMTSFEVEFLEATATDQVLLNLSGGGVAAAAPSGYLRTSTAQSNSDGVGGTARLTAVTWSTDPASTIRIRAYMLASNPSTSYKIKYSALSAIKISDYFV